MTTLTYLLIHHVWPMFSITQNPQNLGIGCREIGKLELLPRHALQLIVTNAGCEVKRMVKYYVNDYCFALNN